MSIIVRQKGHSEVILYSKGADSVIYRNSCFYEAVISHESGFEDPDTTSLPSQNGDGDGVLSADPSDKTGVRGVKLSVAMMRDQTQSHLDDYAKIGLRTLCMAKRVSTVAQGRQVESCTLVLA
jgi:magnesium-transporting ATPase (P-type)